jgi:hypothetical protein
MRPGNFRRFAPLPSTALATGSGMADLAGGTGTGCLAGAPAYGLHCCGMTMISAFFLDIESHPNWSENHENKEIRPTRARIIEKRISNLFWRIYLKNTSESQGLFNEFPVTEHIDGPLSQLAHC